MNKGTIWMKKLIKIRNQIIGSIADLCTRIIKGEKMNSEYVMIKLTEYNNELIRILKERPGLVIKSDYVKHPEIVQFIKNIKRRNSIKSLIPENNK